MINGIESIYSYYYCSYWSNNIILVFPILESLGWVTVMLLILEHMLATLKMLR